MEITLSDELRDEQIDIAELRREEAIQEARDEAKFDGIDDYEDANHKELVDNFMSWNHSQYSDYLDGRMDTDYERNEFIEQYKDDYDDFVKEDYLINKTYSHC
jgi:hypothetical protein